MAINTEQPNYDSKGSLFRAAVARESIPITWLLAETQRQAGGWGSFVVRKGMASGCPMGAVGKGKLEVAN